MATADNHAGDAGLNFDSPSSLYWPMKPELVDFIKVAVPSVWALELLMLLQKDNKAPWDAASAAKELRSNANYILELLHRFEGLGLATQVGGAFSYSPASPVLDALTAQLAQEYRERPIGVMTAIVSVRNDGAQAFADAFRFREGPKK